MQSSGAILKLVLGATLLLGAAVGPGACGDDDSPTILGPLSIDEIEFAPELGVDLDAMVMTESGLYFRTEVEGDGDVAESGSLVTLHYVAWLPDGTKFNDSRAGGFEASFVIDLFPYIIEGVHEGVTGMLEGETRQLVVPPSLAWGEEGNGRSVPPYSYVVFRIDLLSVEVFE